MGLYKELLLYPVYINLSYWWNFGVLAFSCLAFQVITGIFLAMFYISHADLAFTSTEHIMRDINFGWIIRYLHANGASFFFLCVYIHLMRNLYYNSYFTPRQGVWLSGIIILIIMIATAFFGYVLPWGQMSFWAATVITSLFSAIPIFGSEIVVWLWGGFSVDNATLTRFFSFHYLFPFILMAIVVSHVIILHIDGSSNPLGGTLNEDKISFHPYYTVKDIVGIVLFIIVFAWVLSYIPDVLGHPDNYIAANPLVTPAHIVPEWYFLPFYALSRSIPDKIMGILLLVLALVILLFLPYVLFQRVRISYFNGLYVAGFFTFIITLVHLGWLGGAPIEYPFLVLSEVSSTLYFFYLLLGLSFLQSIEVLMLESSNE